jgi:hypothetical protein
VPKWAAAVRLEVELGDYAGPVAVDDAFVTFAR